MEHMKNKLLRAELHCHSQYSKDSNLSLEDMVSALRRAKVDVVALTDHNTIEGAMRLREMAPEGLQVIVGEEIATAEGDLVGIFLTEQIPARLTLKETIRRIHKQGGLAIVPHPFDRLRHEAMGGENLDRVMHDVDFVEVFNARCVFPGDNRAAERFVRENSLHGSVASDAHWMMEHGNANVLIEPFTDARSFAENLRGAEFETKLATPLVHAGTAVVKRIKKLRKRTNPA
jgi:predicted metal-dependent phosphoesterase TrpH